MRSDFINKRQQVDRRNYRFLEVSNGGGGSISKTVNTFLNPQFDTFIFHNPTGYSGSDRWDFIPGDQTPSLARSIPVGFINPWNDAANIQRGIPDTAIAPRTPTRGILSFDISGISQNATILSANLSLNVDRVNQLNTTYLVQYLYTDGTSKGNWKEQALTESSSYLPIRFGIFEYGSGGITSSVFPPPPATPVYYSVNRNWLRNEKEYTQAGDQPTQRIDENDFIFSWTGRLTPPYTGNERIEIGFMRSHGAEFTAQELAGGGLERMIGFINYPNENTWRASVWRAVPIPADNIYSETAAMQTNAPLDEQVNLKVVIYENGSKAKMYVNDSLVLQATGTGPNGQLPSKYSTPADGDSGFPVVFSGFNHRRVTSTTNKKTLETRQMWCRKLILGSLNDPTRIDLEKAGNWLPQEFTP
jgi:hypothetical protein